MESVDVVLFSTPQASNSKLDTLVFPFHLARLVSVTIALSGTGVLVPKMGLSQRE